MVLEHTTSHTYSHPFPTVTLAFFLRYSSPQLNPFSKHVLSTDTLESFVDPTTGRLHTTRIHLKKSRMPSAIFKLLPTSITGSGPSSASNGGTSGSTSGSASAVPTQSDRASYILETSVVDMREGWMRTESRNLNFTGVLEVIERQVYSAPTDEFTPPPTNHSHTPPAATASRFIPLRSPVSMTATVDRPATPPPTTDVSTTVMFRSRLGERFRRRAAARAAAAEPTDAQQQQPQNPPPAPVPSPTRWLSISGWLGAAGVQRTIEALASSRTVDQLGKSREGMRFVLERLRNKGVVGVLVELNNKKRAGGAAVGVTSGSGEGEGR